MKLFKGVPGMAIMGEDLEAFAKRDRGGGSCWAGGGILPDCEKENSQIKKDSTLLSEVKNELGKGYTINRRRRGGETID